MHLSVDAAAPLATLRDTLPRALAAAGLPVATIEDLPTSGFVVELFDPLPAVAAEGPPDVRVRSTWKVAVYARAGGGSRMSTMRPTHLVELMDRPGAAASALALEASLERAILDAAGRADEARRA